MKRFSITIFVIMSLLLVPLMARATMILGFANISANDVGNAAAGEAQLRVAVSGIGVNQARFLFYHVGSVPCSIADVYFDDGSLLGIAYLVDADDNGGDPGVDFSQLANPGELPSANNATPPFVTTAGFSADSDPPAQPNGVNPGEALGIVFDLQGTQTIDDVYDELTTGELRVGIHVQGFADDGSEAFVNGPPGDPIVPEPGTLILLSSGLAGILGYARIKIGRKKKE